MGLLDALDSEQGRLGLGLLMAAGPQAQPMSLGQRLGQGLGYVQAQKMQDAEQKLRELQMQQAGLGAEQSRLGIKKTGIELTEAERSIADREAQRKILAQFYGNQGMPANPQATQSAPQGGAPMSVPTAQQPAQTTQSTIPAKVDKFASYVQLGDLMAKQGQPEAAQKWYDIAEKFRPKYSTTPQQVMVGGKLTNVLIGEDGSIKTMDGYDVKPDMVSTDLGGKVVWQNKNAIQPGASMAKTMTPGEVATTGLAREKFGWEQQQANKPVLHEGQWVTPPSAQNPQGTATAVPGYTKPLTEFQGRSTTYASRMQDAAKIIASLEGKVEPNQVAQAGYRPEFPSWLPGGQPIAAGVAAANKSFNPMVTDEAQQYRQAQENWVTANLRQESGAAIGKDEMRKDIEKWFPQPGDPEALKLQKANARKVAERAMQAQSGPGANLIQGIVGSPTSILDKADAILKGGK